MSRIAETIEETFPYKEWISKYKFETLTTEEAVSFSACHIARRIGAKAITTSTKSGGTTKLVAKYRPQQNILALTPDKVTYRQLALVWGALPILMEEADSTDVLEEKVMIAAKKNGYLCKGDAAVFTAGVPLNKKGNTNLIKVTICE